MWKIQTDYTAVTLLGKQALATNSDLTFDTINVLS